MNIKGYWTKAVSLKFEIDIFICRYPFNHKKTG